MADRASHGADGDESISEKWDLASCQCSSPRSMPGEDEDQLRLASTRDCAASAPWDTDSDTLAGAPTPALDGDSGDA
jgi:hypothetical protein